MMQQRSDRDSEAAREVARQQGRKATSGQAKQERNNWPSKKVVVAKEQQDQRGGNQEK